MTPVSPAMARRLHPYNTTETRSAVTLCRYVEIILVGNGRIETKSRRSRFRRSRIESVRLRYSVMSEWFSQALPIDAKLTK